MHPLSDNDLDRLSREASDQYDVEQSPSAWDKLENRLDKELPVKKEKDRRRFLWIFFFAILLSGAGLFFILNSGSNKKDTTSQTAKTKEIDTKNSSVNQLDHDTRELEKIAPSPAVAETESPVRAQTGTAKKEADNKNSEKLSYSDKNDKKSQPPSISIPNKSKSNSGLIQVDTRLVKTQTKKNNRPDNYGSNRRSKVYTKIEDNKNKVDNRISKGNSSKEGQKTQDDLAVTSLEEVKSDLSKTNSSKVIIDTANNLITNNSVEKLLGDKVTDSTTAVTQAKVDSPITKKTKEKSINKNRWAFTFITGADISKIGGELKNKAGYDLGIQVSYNLTKRLSVNTGFVSTKKFYLAAGKDFQPPKHYFTYYVEKLISVDGSCNMWEIPLNLRYDLISKSKIKWYINGGLSSYIMRKQSYTYDYIYNSVRTKRDWSTSSQQNEWLKIVNLSAGMEYSFNKIWSIQAESYSRLPISGIGFGKMDISSFGMMLGLKYRPKFVK